MRLRRRSSRKSQVVSAVATYLKIKAMTKAFKTARKGVKGLAAYKATKAVAGKAPAPVKALPVVAGVGAAGAMAARRKRNHDREPAAV
jgi:hypothetical protein